MKTKSTMIYVYKPLKIWEDPNPEHPWMVRLPDEFIGTPFETVVVFASSWYFARSAASRFMSGTVELTKFLEQRITRIPDKKYEENTLNGRVYFVTALSRSEILEKLGEDKPAIVTQNLISGTRKRKMEVKKSKNK